ncbi:MAG: PIN domain-containing protein, partial [Chloroflexota bacterium]|nr:PIN domain-containing protein [Chloroflexota bacterium]
NILLDILLPDPKFFASSRDLLEQAILRGRVIISEVVYAELCSQFNKQGDLDAFLEDADIIIQTFDQTALWKAGRAWLNYSRGRGNELECAGCGHRTVVKCEECGETISARQHIISDFLIGGHASSLANTLLTRDRGFYRTYFIEKIKALKGKLEFDLAAEEMRHRER